MSIQIIEAEILKAVEEQTFIVGGDASCVEGLKYDFRLGNQILFGGQEKEHRSLVVNPGELVYVLTMEGLRLPKDIKAELSLKRKLSVSGILVLGGFGIDPGYEGQLLFALYNFSPDPFQLEPGRKLIAAQFYLLSQKEIPPQREMETVDRFPDAIVRMMLRYKPTSMEGLRQAFDELVIKFNNIRDEIDKREQWFSRFEDSLERQSKQIDQLSENLEKETSARQQTERDFRQDIKEIQRETIKSATKISIITTLGLGVTASVILLVVKFLFF